MQPARPSVTHTDGRPSTGRRRPPWWVVVASVILVTTATVRLAAVDDGLSKEDARACAAELNDVLDSEVPVVNVERATATLADGAELAVWRATIGDRGLVVVVDIATGDGTVVAVEPRVGSLEATQRQLLFGHGCG